MKKTILALAALLGTGAMGWAQNTTTTGTSGSTTTNNNTTTTTTTTNSSSNTSVNGNAPTTDNISGSNTTPAGTTGSMVNPGNSNTTGTLQSSTTAGVDYNTLQNTPQGNTQVTLQSNSNYAAYGTATAVPGNLSSNFQRDYPTAFSPTWQQSGDWYRASFNNMNRNMLVYYAPNGNSYSVALPVLNGYVPEEVITKALGTYGSNLYSISRVKAANGQDAYQINTLDGGMARSEFIGEDGSSFAAIDVFRHDDENMASGELMNSSNNAANAMDSSKTTSNYDMSGTGNNATMGTDTNNNMNGVNPSTTTATSTDVNATMDTTSPQEPKFKHKIKTEDGRKLKIKTKKGETRVKGDALDATGGQ